MEIHPVVNTLDQKKHIARKGIEYWRARDLQPVLGYDDWRNFESVISKAKMACDSTGVDSSNHFVETTKMVEIGSGTKRTMRDYFLSRYACYLVAMNGHPGKIEIAIAQNYFAVQTRRQEIRDHQDSLDKRIRLRERLRSANKNLNSAAKSSGVQNYALFYDAGYRGLYDLPLSGIKRQKGLKQNEDLIDRMGRAELAANEFRVTQAEEKLRRNGLIGEDAAKDVHFGVGREVRNTIRKIGGTMPENLPIQPSLKKLEKKRRKSLEEKTEE